MPTDIFNRPNESPLATTGGWNRLSGGTGNAFLTGNLIISDTGANQGDKLYYMQGAADIASQISECRITTAASDMGPAVRIGGAAGLTAYLFTGAGNALGKLVNGSFTTIGNSLSAFINADSLIRLEVEDNVFSNVEIRVYIDGVLRDTITDSTGDKITGMGQGVGFFNFTSVDSSDGLYEWAGGNLGRAFVRCPITSDGQDGTGYRDAATWAGIDTGTFSAESTPELWLSKQVIGTATEDISCLEIDTSAIPNMATVVAARLKEYVISRADSDNIFSIVGDYYHFGGEPTVAGDWIQTADPNIFGPEDLTAFVSSAWNYIDVKELGGIDKTNLTGIRLTLSAGVPTAGNSLEFAGNESTTLPPPELDIDYVLEGHWSRDQARAANASNVVAFPNDVKAGTLLLACTNTSSLSTTTPTDSRGNSWTLIRTTTTVNSQLIAWWYAISKDAGPCTVTFTNALSFMGFVIAEFSTDLSGPITLDVEGTVYRSVAAGQDTMNTATVTASAADSLAISFCGSDTNSTGDLEAGTGEILDANGKLDGAAANDRIAMEHAVVGAGSTVLSWSPTVFFDGQVHIAVFKVGAEKQTYYRRRRVMVQR